MGRRTVAGPQRAAHEMPVASWRASASLEVGFARLMMAQKSEHHAMNLFYAAALQRPR